MSLTLTELERDALTELVNVGVSRAAASLRNMVGRQVLLSVPSVDVVNHAAAAARLGEREGEELVAVSQNFEGAFAGRAMLIFPQSNGLDLVRAVLDQHATEAEAAEMEREALAETGNVILNGCLGTMANMLSKTICLSLPEVIYGPGRALFQVGDHEQQGRAPAEGLVLFLYINFSVKDRDIRGYIAMLMDLPSMASLKLLVQGFITSVMGDDPALA